MTMQELSPQYARQAEAVSRRLRELRQQALTEGDPERVQALRRRQQELRPLLQEARELADRLGFFNARKPDSQDICFVPDGDYAAFIRRHTGKEDVPGDFVDETGRVLGRHKGITHYTIGQRKGLGVSSNEPLYVKAIDPERNQVILSGNDALFSRQLTAGAFNWIAWDVPPRQFRCSAKARYRHPEQPCRVTIREDGTVEVLFDQPQRAITPGQAVVLYDGDTVLGGGTIL